VAGRRSRAPRLALERASMGECDVRVGRFAFTVQSRVPDAMEGPFGIARLSVVVFGDDVADAVCPAERWLVVDGARRIALNKAQANVWGRVVHAPVEVAVGWASGAVVQTPALALELRGGDGQGDALVIALTASTL